MDEPSAGLAPLVVAQVFELVQRIRAEGLTVLIVEQNVQQVLDVVDRAYLLEVGSIKLAGTLGRAQGQQLHPQVVYGAVAANGSSISSKRSSTASCLAACWRCWRSAST